MATGTLITNYTTEQIFLGMNRYNTATYTNSTGSTVTLAAGRLIGRVLASDLVLPHISSATDGSEMPIGVLAESYTVADGASAVITYCFAGDVNQNAVSLGSGDTYATTIRTVSTGGGKLRDLIVRNTDIKLIVSTELGNYDNQ